ncbi:unnamed protein product [Calypogeia fissa]
MAALACRRMLLLTTTPPHPTPPMLSSAAAPISSGLSASSTAARRTLQPLPVDLPARVSSEDGGQTQGWISWRPLPSKSCSCSRVFLPHPSSPDSHQPLVLLCVPPSVIRQGLQTREVVADARGRGAARQLWRTHTTASNSARSFSSVFSQSTPRKRGERFIFMATGGRGQSGGFASSSVLMNSRGAESTRGELQKLVTFESKDGQIAVGVVRGDALWSLQCVFKSPDGKPLPQVSDMESVIKNWSDLKDRLTLEGSGTKVSEVKLLAPIPRPAGVIMCIGKNYLDHVKEVDTWKTAPEITKPEAPKHPIVFTKAPQSVIGPGAAIKYPHGVSSAVDYEAELGVIIGKAGQSIKKEHAMSHIFGYTIINDVTARDVQKRHQQWFLGKSFDTFCPMGPAIVPASELDGNDLQIQCWINDELRQDGRTSQMIFGIPQLIEVISAAITLQPGDIIATGTPAGVGSGFTPPRHLAPGDKIRIFIEGIGELCNVVE